MEIAHLAECDSHFQEPGIRDYRIKLVFLLPAPASLFLSLAVWCFNIYIISRKGERGGQLSLGGVWVEREIKKQGTIKRFTASTFALPLSQPLIKQHSKGGPGFPHHHHHSHSQPIAAHPMRCQATSDFSYFWVLQTDPAVSEQAGRLAGRERLQNWTDSNIIWAMGWLGTSRG